MSRRSTVRSPLLPSPRSARSLGPLGLALALAACFGDPIAKQDDVPSDVHLADGADTHAEDVADARAEDLADTHTADVGDDTHAIDTTETNACGGVGPVLPAAPGEPCGPCLDGETACDPSDAERRRTVCLDASALNACGTCGALPAELGAQCGTCGQVTCAVPPEAQAPTRCAEPAGGCETPLTCADLACGAEQRACVEGVDGADARCGGCVETYAEVGGACLGQAPPPTGLGATADRAADVELTWAPATHATGYRVFRCDGECTDDGDFTELTSAPIAETSFRDATALAPGAPPSPTPSASADLTDRVRVSWPAVTAPTAPRYTYRVQAASPAGPSAPSATAFGSRAERPVLGYEVRIGGGAWLAVAANATSYDDAEAPRATLSAGAISASQGLHPDHVALAVAGASASAGPARTYEVRALSAWEPGAPSSPVSGRVAAAPISYSWERSPGPEAAGFAPIPQASGPTITTWNDTGAPAGGEVRYYRVVVSAQHAEPTTSEAVAGWRQPPPDVPSGVTASSDREGEVRVTWQAVPGATGYHVYRDGVKLTSGGGIALTTYDDTGAAAPASGWAAPTNVAATTDDKAKVTVTWVAPSRPLGAAASYTVSAMNASGEGPRSAAATGRRAAAALSSFELEVQVDGAAASWLDTGSLTTSYAHAQAPAATISGGALTASQGDHRAEVRLTVSGASVVPAKTVGYRLRGKLVGGGTTPTSSKATGQRAVGPLSYWWERSAGSTASGFAVVTSTTTGAWNDTAAPSSGEGRHYRVSLQADGSSTRLLGPAQGWRLSFVGITAGGAFTCAWTPLIPDGGRVWCWGSNALGQLGLGITGPVKPPSRVDGVSVAVEVDAGSDTSCARTAPSEIWCWGRPGTLFPGPSNTARRIGNDSNYTSLSVGFGVACATTSTQTLCWGSDSLGFGLLGNGTIGSEETLPLAVRKEDMAVVPKLLLAKGAASSMHLCGATGSQLRCWGRNHALQLGSASAPDPSPLAVSGPSFGSTITLVAATLDQSCVVQNNSLSCWGRRFSDSTPTAAAYSLGAATGATALEGGGEHLCVRLSSGLVRCLGKNTSGQLGDGTTDDRASPVTVSNLTDATTVTAGFAHTCALIDGGPWCWGNNLEGRLSTSDTGTDVLRPSPVTLP